MDEVSEEQVAAWARELVQAAKQENPMHYRNGREAKNGDKVVQLDGLGQVSGFGFKRPAGK
jgi:hypothetical protein